MGLKNSIPDNITIEDKGSYLIEIYEMIFHRLAQSVKIEDNIVLIFVHGIKGL